MSASIRCIDQKMYFLAKIMVEENVWENLNGVQINAYSGHGIARVGRLFEENHELPETAYSY